MSTKSTIDRVAFNINKLFFNDLNRYANPRKLTSQKVRNGNCYKTGFRANFCTDF